MAEMINNSDKITFKVKHLDEYHDIVIDPNDARYESKYQHQQLFEQLESITGVPSGYTTEFILLRNLNPSDVNNASRHPLYFFNQKAFVPEGLRYWAPQVIFSLNIRDGERFHLQYYISHWPEASKRFSMRYNLVEERDVPDEGCNQHLCQYQCTQSYFKRLKDLVCNYEMNAKMMQLAEPLMEAGLDSKFYAILREFNVRQYYRPVCDFWHRWRLAETGHARQDNQYLRTRG